MFKKYKYFIDEAFRDLTSLGSFWFALLLLTLIVVLGEYLLLSQLTIGIIVTLIVVSGVKLAYFKQRPKKQIYHNFLERIDASSFPSLHAARSLVIALIVANHFGNLQTTIFLIGLAVLVAYSRIYLKKHFWTDVIGGWVLGSIVFWLITFFF